MFRKISIWPLVFASFLVIGHAIFPHTHHHDSDEKFNVATQIDLPLEVGLISFFSHLFSQDLGDNHLEDFKQGSENVSDFVFFAQAFLYSIGHLDFSKDEGTNSIALPYPTPLLNSFITKDTPLRAPPLA